MKKSFKILLVALFVILTGCSLLQALSGTSLVLGKKTVSLVSPSHLKTTVISQRAMAILEPGRLTMKR